MTITDIERDWNAVAPAWDARGHRMCALAAPFAMVLQTASADQLEAVRRTGAELAACYITGDGVALPVPALLVCGRNPTGRESAP